MMRFNLSVTTHIVTMLLMALMGSNCGIVIAQAETFNVGNLTASIGSHPDTPSSTSDSTRIFLPQISNGYTRLTGPLIHIPYYSDSIQLHSNAIFWFGEVTPSDTYIDVRIGYNSEKLQLSLAVFDRLLWVDSTPSASELANWDGASILLSLDGKSGTTPGLTSFRFDNEFYNQSPIAPDTRYMASYQGDGSAWVPTSLPFTTLNAWRSGISPFFNDLVNDFGWMVIYEIPFTSLGLSGPPADGSQWGLSIQQYNRNAATGGASVQVWPEGAVSTQPATWAAISFGAPDYDPPPIPPTGSTAIRNGNAGQVVVDAMVGGSSVCGGSLDFWTEWGLANYYGAAQVNIQSQWDVADQPCFSRYYVTFPLETIPAGAQVISSTLTMYQFGNSNPSEANASMIHVFTISQDWQENTINWNNGPKALENIAQIRVEPLLVYPGDLGVPRVWDISQAVIQAYHKGEPLRLALYESDAPMHSGKYFWSSDADYPYNGLPTVTVWWAD